MSHNPNTKPLTTEQHLAEPQVGQMEIRSFGHGEVLNYQPTAHRLDEKTGEPVIPLVYFQGINGDETLPAVMQEFGERDGRQVIGIRYSGKLEGSAKPIREDHQYYDKSTVVPEIDVVQAEDMLTALDELGVQQVDAIATSRGGLRGLIAMDMRPDLFRSMYGDDIAGQDGRGYFEAHIDAIRLVVSQKVGKLIGKKITHIPASQNGNYWSSRSPRDMRTEQKSVAAADLSTLLSRLGEKSGISIRLGSDVRDKAFRTANIQKTMAHTGADKYVELVENDKGGHSIGTNELAIDTALQHLHDLERAA